MIKLAPFLTHARFFSSAAKPAAVLCEKTGAFGRVTLNRSKQLNAMNDEMIHGMNRVLAELAQDPQVKLVLVKAKSDAVFCAGGDVKMLATIEAAQVIALLKVAYEFSLIHGRAKPRISLMSGLTFGAGVSVAKYGQFQVATEKTLVSMPECSFGFFPDGSSHYLSRLQDGLGLFLVFTGHRISGQQLKQFGLATHFTSSSRLAELEQDLVRNASDVAQATAILDKYNEPASQKEQDNFRALCDKTRDVFSAGSSVEQVVQRLQKMNSDWAKEQLAVMQQRMQPFSLKVTSRLFDYARAHSVEDCFRLDYHLYEHFFRSDQFREGVRRLLAAQANANPALAGQDKNLTKKTAAATSGGKTAWTLETLSKLEGKVDKLFEKFK